MRSQSNSSIEQQAIIRVDSIPACLLRDMKACRPNEVHEKAHVYPISVPERWDEADESIIDWSIPTDRPLRLYVHIPWCRSKCVFCFYESKEVELQASVSENYMSCLKRELSIYCERLGKDRLAAETLYIGGGTPSILSAEQIDSLFALIHDHVEFEEGASLIAEVSPGTLTKNKVSAFVAGGINRISMGVQDFQDHVLRKCGRDHSSMQAVEAYRLLREANVAEINLDLMLGLPEQRLVDFTRSVKQALALAPSSISFLDLRVASGSELHRKGHYKPDWREKIIMRAIHQDLLERDGRYERSRPHYYILPEEARGRSTRVPCLDSRPGPGFQIGIGVTAYSHLGDVGSINGRNPLYSDCLGKGRLPVSRGLIFDEEDKTAMMAIRAIVDQTVVPEAPSVLAQYWEQIDYLKKKNLVDENYKLTNDGCLFGEEIAYMFYPKRGCPGL